MVRKLDTMEGAPTRARAYPRPLRLVSRVAQMAWQRAQRLVSDSLLRNSMFIMGTTVATSGLGYIYWTAAARVFPAAAVGLASALISAVNLVSAVSLFGLPSAVIDLLPKQRSSRSWSATADAALGVVTLSGLVFGAGMWLLLPNVSPNLRLSGSGAVVAILLVGLVTISNVVLVLDGIFIADRVAHFMLARNVVFAAAKIPLLLLPLFLPLISRTASTILFSWILAGALSLALSLLWFLPRMGRQRVTDVATLREKARLLASRMAGNQLIRISGTLPMYLLPIIVAMRLTTADSAYFYTTWMVGGIFFMISTSISSALFAEGSAERDKLSARLRTSVRIMGFCLAPVGGALLLFGRLALEVFGPAYAANGAVLLSILVFAAAPDGITNLAVSVWRVRGHVYAAGMLNLGMSVISLVAAWFLTPIFGVAGAGWAWLLGESAGSAVVLAYLAPQLRLSISARLRQSKRS